MCRLGSRFKVYVHTNEFYAIYFKGRQIRNLPFSSLDDIIFPKCNLLFKESICTSKRSSILFRINVTIDKVGKNKTDRIASPESLLITPSVHDVELTSYGRRYDEMTTIDVSMTSFRRYVHAGPVGVWCQNVLLTSIRRHYVE